jgi:hypothetical protein
MEEFIKLMEKNIESMAKKTKFTKYRELLNIILSNKPPSIEKISKGKDLGDLYFSVPLKDLGVSFEVFSRYEEELFSPYIGNTLGELLIRENIDEFAELLTNLGAEEYIPVVYSWKHTKFGLEIVDEKIVFYFHSNLIHKILTEDLREKI